MGSEGFRNPEVVNILESRRLVSVLVGDVMIWKLMTRYSVCDVMTVFGGNSVVTRVSNGTRIPSALVQVLDDAR